MTSELDNITDFFWIPPFTFQAFDIKSINLDAIERVEFYPPATNLF